MILGQKGYGRANSNKCHKTPYKEINYFSRFLRINLFGRHPVERY
jgi:hypothetical protein